MDFPSLLNTYWTRTWHKRLRNFGRFSMIFWRFPIENIKDLAVFCDFGRFLMIYYVFPIENSTDLTIFNAFGRFLVFFDVFLLKTIRIQQFSMILDDPGKIPVKSEGVWRVSEVENPYQKTRKR